MVITTGSCESFGICKPEQALDKLQKPLALYRQLGDRAGEAQVLSEMALNYETMAIKSQTADKMHPAYSDPAKANQALNLYQQAADIYTSIGDKAGRQQTLRNIAVIHQKMKQIDQAKEFYHQALSVADGNAELENLVVCTIVGTPAFGSDIQLKDLLDVNGYLSVGDQYLHAERVSCPSVTRESLSVVGYRYATSYKLPRLYTLPDGVQEGEYETGAAEAGRASKLRTRRK
jgi:tetratricopeptide (TPR) repeat protein